MGLGLDYQQKNYSDLSTGLLKVGTDDDDPSVNITVNDNISAVGTRFSATEVNFQITNHAQYGTAVGKFIKTTGYVPAAYNIEGVILSLPDANNIRVTSLSDTVTDDTTTGVVDFGSINVTLSGKYRIVDRVNDSNATPANNQFSKSRSRVFNWSAVSNLDHTAIAAEGNIVIIVDDTGVITLVQLSSGEAILAPYDDTDPHLNSHVQIGNITKSSNQVSTGTNESSVAVNNNIYNKLRNVMRRAIIDSVNSADDPIIFTPIALTMGVAKNSGVAFIAADAGGIQSKGFNPNQNRVTAASPELILTVDRAGDGSIVNVSSVVNNTEYEIEPGVYTTIGLAPKSANRFMHAFRSFTVELLGEINYFGVSPLTEAAAAVVNINNPSISRFGIPATRISVESGATDSSLTDKVIFTVIKKDL